MYIVEHFQVYSEFFYMALACTVLNMMLERYKVQSCLLRDQIKCRKRNDVVKLLKQIKFNVFMLKQAVDAFNEIFGWIGICWTILLCDTVLKEFELLKKILLLKETVNCFNDIFGGTILLNILFSSLKSIIYLDRIVKSQDVSADHTSGFFVLLHLTQIGVIVIIV
ncbi:uncharacterized protein [Tenebrio molitor]|uniref:uncharacterized protein n=1 Tax=Tenebrio molitor TaxID=7067 RepID=UPI00362481CE